MTLVTVDTYTKLFMDRVALYLDATSLRFHDIIKVGHRYYTYKREEVPVSGFPSIKTLKKGKGKTPLIRAGIHQRRVELDRARNTYRHT